MKKEFTIGLVISLFLHALMVLMLTRLGALTELKSAMEVFLLTPEGGWQIVDITHPLEEKRPEKAKFLGMYDQAVGEEMVTSKQLPVTSEERRGAKDEGRRTKDEGRGKNDERRATSDERQATSDERRSQVALLEPQKNLFVEEGKASPPGSYATLPEDYYPDYKRGEHTYLNVLKHPDVEYFVRLKRVFKTTWDPAASLHREVGLNLVARGSLQTVVAVAVDNKGELSELFILRSSGIAGYDDEAIRTVRASSPFSTPPSRFLDDDGILRMSWTFVLYL